MADQYDPERRRPYQLQGPEYDYLRQQDTEGPLYSRLHEPAPPAIPTLGQRVLQHMPGMAGLAEGLASPQGQILATVMGGGPKGFIRNPVRGPDPFPGVWQSPQQLVADVKPQIVPESPWLKRLFNVNRRDLSDIAHEQIGDIEPADFLKLAKNPKGSEAAANLMTPLNTERIQDVIDYTRRKAPDIYHGAAGWYVSNPMHDRMVDLAGPAEAVPLFNRLNFGTSAMSAGNPVPQELRRGAALNYLMEKHGAEQGAALFNKFGGLGQYNPEAKNPLLHLGRIGIEDVPGHAYHGAQMSPVLNWMAGQELFDRPKVPIYTRSFGVPNVEGIGMQSRWNTPDSHDMRSSGAAMSRREGNVGREATMAEQQMLGPWYDERLSAPLGLPSRVVQPVKWTVYAPQTGVDTPVGSPKLEQIANLIGDKIAPRWGVSPEKARDMYLRGKAYSPWLAAPLGAASLYGQQPEQ